MNCQIFSVLVLRAVLDPPLVKTADGIVVTSAADVEAEITTHFTALFHGCHVASTSGNPVDFLAR
jgi:hypothetical protein